MRRRVSAGEAPKETLEVTDARKRRNRRKDWRRKSRRPRKLDPHGTPAAIRRRSIESAIEEAGAKPGTVQAFEVLQSARDETNRRLMHFAATPLLRSYAADAEAPTAGGWMRVPTDKTQRRRADALDICDKYVRDLNRDLVAAGLLRDGGLHYVGDGVRGYVGRDGKHHVLPLKRRVWWLAPAVAEIVARASAAASSESKVGNPFPADRISDQPFVLDPSSAPPCASSGSLPSHPSTPATVCTDRRPLELPLCFAPVSAVEERSEGAAVAAPVNQLHIEDHPPLELATTDRVPERPTAAPRGGAANLDPPSVIITQAVEPSTLPAGDVPSPDPSTVRQQTGGSPPPVTPPSLSISANDRDKYVPSSTTPPASPVSASNARSSSAPTSEAHRSALAQPSAPRSLRDVRSSSPRSAGQPARRGYLPEPRRGHSAGCDCAPCWIASSVRSGAVVPRPHPVGHGCKLCWAWSSLTLKQWQRYRDPRPAPCPIDAAPDPTLRLLQRLSSALGAGALTQADYERLTGLFLDGRELDVAAELDERL